MSATSASRSNSPLPACTGRSEEPRVRWRRHVDEQIRSLDTLVDPDYCDAVTGTVSQNPASSPEQWARVAAKRMPPLLRITAPLVQRVLLRLPIELSRSRDHVFGWRVSGRGENWLRMEAASSFLTAHLVWHLEGDQLSLATFVRYDRPIAALVWPPVSIIHRHVASALVRAAVRSREL